MVFLQNMPPSCLSYSRVLLSDMKAQELSENNSVVQLVSGDEKAYVHSALLKNVSSFLHDLLSSSCLHKMTVLILPSSSASSLENLVTLIYTGKISGLSMYQVEDVVKIAKELSIETTKEKNISSLTFDIETNDDVSHSGNSDKQPNLKELKTDTIIVKKNKSLRIKFPKSRTNRQHINLEIKENLSGLFGRVQKEYNRHPVGKYMGPYDQNRNLKLNIQLPDSDLDFESYTEFIHDGDECFVFALKAYKRSDDLEKIDAYQIVAKTEDLEDSDADSDDNENEVKMYSCQFGNCKIPCPCPQCHLDSPQCAEHRLKHQSLFDENKDSISIKSSDYFCEDKTFFKNSSILKFSGIPLSCKKCKQDLLYHDCYHFEYHEKCRFCKQSWFKYKAKTEEELKDLEKQEREYFKRVCPYCDKQFITASHVKKHIDYEHNQVKFKCGTCNRTFNSKKAKTYHEKVEHSPTESFVQCEVCKKNFGSEVNLKSHLKYVHSEERKESCPHCDASFKQKKNLRAHLANIHDIDQMTEKYCETYKKSLFKCKECDVEFMYEKNLKAHIKTKHGDKAIVYKCELCPSKYSNKRTLVAHVKMKHK